METLQIENNGNTIPGSTSLASNAIPKISSPSSSGKIDRRENARRLKAGGKKQKEIAKLLGVCQQSVSNLFKEENKKSPSRHFNLDAVLDIFLAAIADGGSVENNDIPRRVLNRLVHAGILRKSTVPRFYVLTEKTLEMLAGGREFNFIRFALFDVRRYDRLGADELETKLAEIRDMWKRRISVSSS
ncbi:MAG: hypothetical protein M1587_05090 [Thaumarchaeota archaeon]|nr:hypothetical protein [Nitrososphaerota archaeon]